MYLSAMELLSAVGARELTRMVNLRGALRLAETSLVAAINGDAIAERDADDASKALEALTTALTNATHEINDALRKGNKPVPHPTDGNALPNICKWLVIADLDVAPTEHTQTQVREMRRQLRETWSKQSTSNASGTTSANTSSAIATAPAPSRYQWSDF